MVGPHTLLNARTDRIGTETSALLSAAHRTVETQRRGRGITSVGSTGRRPAASSALPGPRGAQRNSTKCQHVISWAWVVGQVKNAIDTSVVIYCAVADLRTCRMDLRRIRLAKTKH